MSVINFSRLLGLEKMGREKRVDFPATLSKRLHHLVLTANIVRSLELFVPYIVADLDRSTKGVGV